MDEIEERELSVRCRCNVNGSAPWSGHDMPWSPASFVAGVVIIAIAAVAAFAGRQPWVAPLIAAVLLVAIVAAAVDLRRDGHDGTCWAARSAWRGVATIGVPLRLVAGLPF